MAVRRVRRMSVCASVLVAGISLSLGASGREVRGRSNQDGHTWRVTVTRDAPDADLGDGVCNARGGGCSLRAAIQEANVAPDADVVVVPAGEYAIEIADLGAVEPADGAADELQGDLDVRGPLAIEGAGRDQVALTGKGDYTVLHVHRAATLTLRGVFVRDSGSVAASQASGACVLNVGELRVVESAFRNCFTAIRTEGPLVVTDSYFAGNHSTGGGAIETYYARGTVVVERSRFVRNKATAGGAIESNFGAVRISDSTFEANSATGGGAISVVNAPLIVERSSFLANEATGGGAIHFDGQRSGTSAVIKESAFEANRSIAAKSGGMVLVGGATLTNVTIDAPRADLHGAIVAYGDLRLDHVTIAGGGLIVEQGSADVHNSLLVGARCTGIVVSRGHNVVSDSDCPLVSVPSDRLDAAAPLLPMADNGGPTRSRLPDPAGGMHPAIDAADPAGCPATDQRGYDRPAGAGCDVGAVEVGAAPPAQTATPTATAAPPSGATASPTRPWNPPTPTAVVTGQLPDRLELAAQMGGALEDIVAWDSSGAVLAGPELRVVDLADPDAPRVTGRLSFDRLGMALVGPTRDGAVLALLEGTPPEVVEVKVTFTTRPTIRRRWRLPEPPPPPRPLTPDWTVTRFGDLAIVGQRVYAAWLAPYGGDDQFLIVYALDLDAPNPTWNVVFSRKGTYTAIVDLAVTPTRAFLVYRPRTVWSDFTTDRVLVIGLDSQTNGELSEYAVAPLVAIVARGETAWAIGRRVPGLPQPSGYGRPNRVLTIDAADAVRPRVVATTTLTQKTPLQSAALSGDRLWLATGADVTRMGEGELLALDVAATDAPAPAGPPIALGAYARVVAAAGDRVIVGDAGAWLRVATADGANVTPRGELPGLGGVFEVATDGARLYAAGEAGAASLSVIGLDDPSAPQLISAWGRDHKRFSERVPIGVAVAGDRVWVTDGTGASAVDVADPAAPRTAGHWLDVAFDVAVDGDTAWIVGAAGSPTSMDLHAVDSDGRSAAVRGPFAPRENLMSIAIGDDHLLYPATLNGTVVGLAPDGLAAPRFLAAIDPSHVPAGAVGPRMFGRPCCYGQIAVSHGIGVAPFANATFFRAGADGPGEMLSSVAGPSRQIEGAVIDDGRVVLAAGADGVGLIDARDASRPVIRGWTDTPGQTHRVAVDGAWVYVADGAGGLRIYRAVVDAPPRPLPQVWLPWGGRP